MSNSLWPHGVQYVWLPCPSLSPGICLNSCPLSQWCHSTISYMVGTWRTHTHTHTHTFTHRNLQSSGERLLRLSWVKVTRSCLTLCDPMDYMVHGILQARRLEWVAFPFSRGSSQPKDWTLLPHCGQILYQLSHKASPRVLEWIAYPSSSGYSWLRNRTRVSCIAGRFFTNCAIREALSEQIYIKCLHSPRYVCWV